MALSSRTRELSLLFILIGHVLCESNVKFAETGKTYTFMPNIKKGLQSILWKFNSDKVVEFEEGLLTWYQFKDQGLLNNLTGVLTLRGLQEKNSGLYESDILVDGIFEKSSHDLKVIDAVGVPDVNCTKNSDGHVTSLECYLQLEAEEVTFAWLGPEETKTSGKTLEVTDTNDNNRVFFCTAENPVSKKTKEFNLKDCQTSESSKTTVIAVVSFFLLLAIIVAIAVFVYKKKSGAGFIPIPLTGKAAGPENDSIKICIKDDGKIQESSKNIGNDNTGKKTPKEKEHGSSKELLKLIEKKQEDLDDLTTENAKAEEQEAPGSEPEKGQSATSNAQQALTGDESNAAESNGGADLPSVPGTSVPGTVIDENDLSAKGADPPSVPGTSVPGTVIDENDLSAKGADPPSVPGTSVPGTVIDENDVESAEGADPPFDEGPGSTTNFTDENDVESAEGQDQIQDTVDSNSDVRRVEEKIAKFESLAWKPRELTSRHAGQNSGAV